MTVYNTLIEKYGMDPKAAAQCFYVLDKDGLITKARKNIKELSQFFDDIEQFAKEDVSMEGASLINVVKNIKPTVIIGQLFNFRIECSERPIFRRSDKRNGETRRTSHNFRSVQPDFPFGMHRDKYPFI